MKILRFSLASWAGLLAMPMTSAASVRRLTAGTFDSAVADKGDLLVMFYKPGCAPCKELLPEFEAAADALSNVRFAKLNAADNAAIAQKYGVKGLPELRYFKEREPQAIDGSAAGRTKDDIVAWAEKIATAPDRIVELPTVAAIEGFIQSTLGTVSVVGVFESAEHAEMFVLFATSFRYPVRFGWVTTAAVEGARAALSLEMSEPNVAVLFKPFDEPRVEFALKEPLEGSKKSRNGLLEIMEKMMGVPPAEAAKLIPECKDSKALGSWLQMMMLPLLVPFTDSNMHMIFEGPVKAHSIVVYDPKDKSRFAALEAWLGEVAEVHRGQVLHILMPATNATAEIREYFGVGQSTLPTVVFSDMRGASEDKPQGTQHMLPKETALGLDTLVAFEKSCLQKYDDAKKKSQRSSKQEL